jgi:lipopolysaccharide/colanic/teichoic acid biosynthesis glycosyltransferase
VVIFPALLMIALLIKYRLGCPVLFEQVDYRFFLGFLGLNSEE